MGNCNINMANSPDEQRGSITQWIDQVHQGNSLGANELWNHYYQRLIRLARKKLLDTPRRVADEDDVVLDAFNSFYQGVKAGRFPKLDDRDDLWQILVMLTARKAINQMKHGARQKRGGGQVRGESIFGGNDPGENAGIDQIVGSEPSPGFAEDVARHCSELLDRLEDETLRQVALAKMEGFSNREIAHRLEVKERTIERKLKLIREIWSSK